MVSTGIPLLDDLLGSGYPEKSVILIEGAAVTQRERLGYRFIDAGLARGDFCLYVTRLSERDAELEGRANGLRPGHSPSWIASEGGDLKFNLDELGILSIDIKALLDRNSARKVRVVLDFLSPMLILNPAETVYSFLSQLLANIKQRDAVLLGLVEPGMHRQEVVATVEDLFDGVIYLGAPEEGENATLLTVKKMRGVRLPLGAATSRIEWRDADAADPDIDRSRRIAVLPLASFVPDPEDSYFADGMTDELISALSNISGLSVTSRTSAMKFKDAKKTVSEIGKELNASVLLQGSVRKSEDRVRISVQLIEAAKDQQLWAASYDRNFVDIFSMQSDIAQNVASALRVTLLKGDKMKLRKSPTADPEAHALYLKGRSFELRDTQASLTRAGKLYQAAIRKDPGYALAYASLSWTTLLMGWWEMAPPIESFQRVRELATKAISLDPSLPEAHNALGWALLGQWNFMEAEVEFDLALALDPNSPAVLAGKANLMRHKGRLEECDSLSRRALEVDPLSPNTLQEVATNLLYSGHTDEAIALHKKVLEIDPEATFARENIGLAYVRKGMFDEGITLIRESIRMQKGFNVGYVTDLGYALGKAERVGELRDLLTETLEWQERTHRGAIALTSIYANLGENDKAFEWLERAFEEHSGYLPVIAYDWAFDRLRQDPRMEEMIARVGLR